MPLAMKIKPGECYTSTPEGVSKEYRESLRHSAIDFNEFKKYVNKVKK